MIRIRGFTIGDLPHVAEIRNASIAISPDFYAMTVDRVRSPAHAINEELTSEILVAEIDGKVRGYLHLYTDPALMAQGRINIDGLHVHPECQRDGLGDQLLQAAMRRAQEWGGRYFSIAIPAGVVSSQTFLLKHGFTLVRHCWKLRHADLGMLPTPELPAGYGFRAFRQGVDEEGYVELLNVAMAEHWEFAPVNRVELERWRQRPDFNPRGCFFITHGPLDVAVATVLLDRSLDDPGQSAARIFEFGVLPAHRGRRLGYQILLRAAELARELELPALELIVDGRNGQVKTMYERVGFQEKRALLVFHRELA